jgi:NAD(P)H-dependent FMN reductase
MWKSFIFLSLLSFTTLNATPTVLAFSGSSRTDSVNKKLVLEAACIAREQGADVIYIDLKHYPIPLYDADVEAEKGMPEYARQIRNLMIKSEVILIASPEYNGSLTALLKNTIDWTSRNETGGFSQEAFKNKKFVIMSASPGRGGGAKGLVHLREILECIGGVVVPQCIAVGDAYHAFDENGKLKDPFLYAKLQCLIEKVVN